MYIYFTIITNVFHCIIFIITNVYTLRDLKNAEKEKNMRIKKSLTTLLPR